MAEGVVAGAVRRGSGLQSSLQLCGNGEALGLLESQLHGWLDSSGRGWTAFPKCPRVPVSHLLPPMKEQRGSNSGGPWGSLPQELVTQNKTTL